MNPLSPAHWQRAQFPSPGQFKKELIHLYLLSAGNTVLPKELLASIINTATAIYAAEFPPLYADLPRHQTKLTNPQLAYKLTLAAFVKSLIALTKHFPHLIPIEDSKPLFTVTSSFPYNEHTHKAYEAFAEPFTGKHAQELQAHGVFAWDTFEPHAWSSFNIPEPTFSQPEPTRGDQIDRREWRANKRRFEETKLKRWKAEKQAYEAEHKSADATIWTPLIHTPYFNSACLLVPYRYPLTVSPETWFSSTWICAPQGKGKTNLLHNIIKDRRPHGTIILMDAKGELIGPYMNEAFIIEPSLTNPPQINPLDIGSSIHAVELLEYLFSALLSAPMTPKQSTLFSGVLTLLVTVPEATVETFRQVFTNGWKPYEQYVNALPKRDKEFFTLGAFDSSGYNSTKEEVLWRLQLLLRNPYMAKMLEVPRTGLDMGKLMDSGKIIVINNNPDILGDLGAEFFGRFMLALVWNAVRARANSGSKVPVYFIIDEAQTVISRDDNIPKLIHQCRSQNVALIFAHQELSYIKSEDVKNALGNCAIRFCAPDGETAVLAPRFRTTPDFLSHLPPYHFAACIRDKETVAVTVPLLTMPMPPRRPVEAPPVRPIIARAPTSTKPEEFG